MEKRYILSALCVALFFFGTVATVHANTYGSALAATENTALYAITYTFTTEDYALALPVITDRSQDTAENSKTTNFTFTTSVDGNVNAGNATGLVLSSAAIKNGQYYIPENTTASFTLFVVLTLDADDPRAKYGLKMTNLPFTIIKDGQENQQNITSLSKYNTKEVGLN